MEVPADWEVISLLLPGYNKLLRRNHNAVNKKLNRGYYTNKTQIGMCILNFIQTHEEVSFLLI